MSDIDITDVARGRRITAVAANDLEMVPRRASRPKRRSTMLKLWKRVLLKMRMKVSG